MRDINRIEEEEYMTVYGIGRGFGKTTRACFLSELTGKPILVKDEMRKRLVMERANTLCVRNPDPITVNDLINWNKYRADFIDGYIIDDADDVLSYLITLVTNYKVTNPKALMITPNVTIGK